MTRLQLAAAAVLVGLLALCVGTPLVTRPAVAGTHVDAGVRPVVITPDSGPVPASLLWRS
jgi:hypothetical protein